MQSIISNAIGIIPQMWDRISALRAANIDRNSFLYACYFEAKLNLEIIAALNLTKLHKAAGTPAFAELVDSFETEATLTLLAGGASENYETLLKLLNEHWKAPDKPMQSETGKPGGESTVTGVLDSFNFAVRKIEALKRISRIAGKEATFLKDFRLGVRLENIEAALDAISNCMASIIKQIETKPAGKRKGV